MTAHGRSQGKPAAHRRHVRSLFLLTAMAVALLTLLLFCTVGCAGEDTPDSDTETATSSVTEPVTNPATETPTEPATEAPSETDSAAESVSESETETIP